MPSHTKIVTFAASDGLTQRKLIPALYASSCKNIMTGNVAIIEFIRKEKSHEQFRTELGQAIAQHSRFKAEAGESGKHPSGNFSSRSYYHQGNFGNADDYHGLLEFLDSLTPKNAGSRNCILHMRESVRRPQLPGYQSGSWERDEANDLIRKDLRKWRNL